MIKILMISGSVPPEACGVGDYTTQLTRSLRKIGVDVILEKFKFLLVRYEAKAYDMVHLQYPSIGYGKSLLPQLASFFFRPLIVTIHEYTQTHVLRRWSVFPFLLLARIVIVTNDHEKKALIQRFFWVKKKLEVISVFSAIEPEAEVLQPGYREGIVYFGLMRPNKGLEEFIGLVKLLKNKGVHLHARIYSAIPKGAEEYYQEVLRLSSGLGIQFYINQPLVKVSAELLKSKYAFLYFPDGLTERRSSFMAAMAHGLLVISNSDKMTSKRLSIGFIDVSTIEEAFKQILILEDSPDACIEQQQNSLDIYNQHYSSEKISQLHVEIYKKIAGKD